MKSKEELKSFFENGDIPKQDQFWEWQDSYWHKDEKLPLESVDYDFSNKADLIDGKIPATQLPSYVDDILEFDSIADLPNPGEGGKIYIVTSTNTQLRWSGSEYIKIISGENVMITDSPQDVFPEGKKTFWTDNDNNSLHIKNTNSEGAGITFDSNGVGQIRYNDDQFYFTNNDGTNNIPVVSEGFKKEGSNNEFYLTGGGDHVHNLIKEDAWYHSHRDFPNGTLIETDVDYSQDYGDQFLLEIKGNMYDNSMPLDAKIQGYIYLNGTNPLLNLAGYTTCYYWKSITALNRNGKLCFWFPRLSYWQGFDVKLTVGYGGIGQGKNRVISVIDSPDPIGTKRVDIYLKTLATQEFVSSQPFSTITSAQINNWDNSHAKTIVDFNKTSSRNGDTFTVNKQDGSTISHTFYGAGIVDTRVQDNGLDSDGSSTYIPNSSNPNLDYKVTPLFHDGSRGWQSSLLLKGWGNNYKAWKITGDANADDVERDVYISSSKSSDGTWQPERKIWTEKNFNPDSKANALENATAIGFQSGLSTGYPYFYHNTDGHIPLATQDWANNNFYTKPEINTKLSAVYKPKGSVANFASLPTTGNTEGDVWNLLDTGANVVWVTNLNNTGVAGWDKLSETVDLTNYMNLTSEQIATGRKIFGGSSGNRFDESAIETRGNGSAIYPAIGFHQPGNYAGTISLRNTNYFHFRNTDDSDFNFLLARGYVKSGSDDNYLLLGGGGHKAISEFASSSSLGDYLPKSGGTLTGDGRIEPTGSIYLQQTATSANATGMFWEDIANSDRMAGIGALTQDGVLEHTYMGWGPSPWYGPTNLSVGPTKFTYKDNKIFHAGETIDYSDALTNIITAGGNTWGWRKLLSRGWNPTYGFFSEINVPSSVSTSASLILSENGNGYIGNKTIWHEGNFIPGSKANAMQNATGVGFSSGNLPTNDGVEYPYFYYNNGTDQGFIPIATQGWVNNTFATKNQLNDYVTRSTNQIIDGSKTFSSSSIVDFKGNDQNNVTVYKTSAGVAGLVSGHEYTHYNTRWRVGNRRGNSTNSLGYSFEFSNDHGVTYTEKARIDEAGFFLGNAFASPVITGAQVFNANNTNQLFFGNDVIPTVFYQTLGSHVFQVNGNITATINSGGVAVNGALSINGQDVATQSWSTSSFIPSSQKGAANGIATLDTNGLIPTTQLPSYVDDVLEFTNLTSFPTTGESGKIYVALDTNKTYRWSGSSYIYITSGAVDSVNGQTGIVNLSKTDIGLGNIDNTSDLNKPVSTATQTALNGKEGAFSKNTAFNKNFGTTSGTVTEGNHVGSGGTAHANATTSAAGFMSGADKTKLDNIDTSNFVTINTAQTIQEDKDFSSTSDVRFLGNDQNNILVHKSSTGFGGALVSGHDYTHYNTRWRVGNVRGGSTNSTALGFHFSSDNGASFSNRVSINSSDGQINTAIHGNSAEWYNISQNGMYRGNMGLSIYEIYQEIDSINTINLDDPNVQNYNIIYNDANLNGSITIYTLQNSQAFKFTNVSSVGILRIDIDAYGYVDAINPGESRTYVAWGSGKLMRHNPDGTITQMI